MPRVAVAGEDRHFVAEILKADGGVDDEAFGAADAEIWVEEDDVVRRPGFIALASGVVVCHVEDRELLI